MRVTHRMMVENAIRSMSENLEQINGLQTKAATGKRFQKASDSPAAARASLSLRSSLQSAQAYLDTANSTVDWLSATEAALGQLEDLGTRAVNKALEGLSDTNSGARSLLAQEMDAFLNEAITAGNTQHQGSYLFAGFKTQTQPFALVSGSPDTVVFSGDNGAIQRNLRPDRAVTINIDGQAALSPLFEAMIAARDALNADDTTAVQGAVTDLQAALQGVIESRGLSGSRGREVQGTIEHLEETQSALAGLLSQEEDVNMAEVIASLRQQETVFQATLEVGNRTLAMLNLFDLLG